MLINRHNYEEFFLLYVDNELSVADRKAVEAFVEQNPDLEEELVMMMQSVLRPDKHIVFANKESLLKNRSSNGLVNESNYEEYFVLYGDNELSNEEKDLVEQFVYKHPQYQAEFELIQQARFIPEQTVSYPDKNELYRTEDDDKVIPFRWWKIAAAAMVLLFLGVTAWYITTSNNRNRPELAGNDTPVDTAKAIAPVNNNEQMAVSEKKTPVVKENIPAPDVKNNFAVKQEKNNKKKSNIHEELRVPQENNDYVEVKKESRATPQPINTAIIAPPVDKVQMSKVLASLDKPGTAINNPEPKEVTYYIEEPNADNINIAMTSINKKPVRGLMRKVKGLFEGNNEEENEPRQESKKGIRIAAFEIGLK